MSFTALRDKSKSKMIAKDEVQLDHFLRELMDGNIVIGSKTSRLRIDPALVGVVKDKLRV